MAINLSDQMIDAKSVIKVLVVVDRKQYFFASSCQVDWSILIGSLNLNLV